MITLIKEFLKTGIEANKKQIEAAERSMVSTSAALKAFRLSGMLSEMQIEYHNTTVFISNVNRDIRIEEYTKKKRKTLAEKSQLKLDLIVKGYIEENNSKTEL